MGHPTVSQALCAALSKVHPYLRADGATLLWNGPKHILTAADRAVLAKARESIVAALAGQAVAEQPESSAEIIPAGPYSGFKQAGEGAGRPDPTRAALVVLEALAYRLE